MSSCKVPLQFIETAANEAKYSTRSDVSCPSIVALDSASILQYKHFFEFINKENNNMWKFLHTANGLAKIDYLADRCAEWNGH